MYHSHRNWPQPRMPKEEKRSERVTGPNSSQNKLAKGRKREPWLSEFKVYNLPQALLWTEVAKLPFRSVTCGVFSEDKKSQRS